MVDPRHLWVQCIQHGLELELNGTLSQVDDASRAAAENHRILKGVSNWLDKRAEIQRGAAELDRRRREGHFQIHVQWKAKFAEIEKDIQEKQAALEEEFYKRLDELEDWRRTEDVGIEREWSQKKAALESSEVLAANLQQMPPTDSNKQQNGGGGQQHQAAKITKQNGGGENAGTKGGNDATTVEGGQSQFPGN